jgi:hypothetical protein
MNGQIPDRVDSGSDLVAGVFALINCRTAFEIETPSA